MTYEGIRLKLLGIWRKGFASARRSGLNKCNFTIISNNCWGGMIYESYNLKKMSPTVGMFFMAKDYIKFLKNIEKYLKSDIEFISPTESVWENELSRDKSFGNYPIGRLKIIENGVEESVELFFLHYKDRNEVIEKWYKRIKRINWDCLIVKFNDQNGCTLADIEEFDRLEFSNKICFTIKEICGLNSVVKIDAPYSHQYIRASYEPFGNNKQFNVTKFINQI